MKVKLFTIIVIAMILSIATKPIEYSVVENSDKIIIKIKNYDITAIV